jgi:hypothetical protein
MVTYLFALALFNAPVKYPSSAIAALRVRDLDGDGFPEIVLSGNQVDELGAFSLLPNRGDGTFAAERLIASGFGEEVQDVGDLDGDGIPDLVVSNYWSNGIAIYLGKGALQFDAGTFHGTATHGGPTLIADYDRDGKADVISFSFGSGNPVRVHLFRGNGNGTLASKTTIDTQLANADAPSPRIINGALEILVNERSANVGIIRYANGMVTTSFIPMSNLGLSSAFADLNGDGIADIVDTLDDGDISVALGNADDTFREPKIVGHVTFPTEVRVADLDGDGHADLVVSDFRSTNLYYFRGHGDGNFEQPVAIDAGGPVNAFEIADVNRDGHLDLVTANNDHTVSVILNRGAQRRHAVPHAADAH